MSFPSIIEEQEEYGRGAPREHRTISSNQQAALVRALVKIRSSVQEEQHRSKADELSSLTAFNNMNMPLLAVAINQIDNYHLQELYNQVASGSATDEVNVQYTRSVRSSLDSEVLLPLFNSFNLVTVGEEKALREEERNIRVLALRVELLTYISAVLSFKRK